MTDYCKWCGSGRHNDEHCPTLNLVNALTGKDYDSENLPDFVSMMDADELLSKTEEELHGEVKALNCLRKN